MIQTFFQAQDEAQVTTNDFEDIAETEVDIDGGQRCVAVFLNTDGSNTATLQMLARHRAQDGTANSADYTDWTMVPTVSAVTVGPGATVKVDCRDFDPVAARVKFQCKSTTPGSHADGILAFGTVGQHSDFPDTIKGAFDPTA